LRADEFVKRFSAILFGLLLVWAQLLAAPALVASARPANACCHCGGKTSCCSAQSSGSQPMPAGPSNAGAQKQFSISAPAIVTGILPENRTGLVSSDSRLSSMPEGAPLYARDCARLI
jgi:hypothetical protein